MKRAGQYISILEDTVERMECMKAILASDFPGYSFCFFNTAEAMIDWISGHMGQIALFSLDHDLIPETGGPDPGSGREVADFLAGQTPSCPVILHSTNYYAREGMKYALLDAGWEVAVVSPTPEITWIEDVWRATVTKLLKGCT